MGILLPLPKLVVEEASGIPFLTDTELYDESDVCIAFSFREGGVSTGGFSTLNLADHVGDEESAVQENRRRFLGALGAPDALLVNPRQVHGTNIVDITSADPSAVCEQERRARREDEGCDGLVVTVRSVGALLCFADCASLIIVAPSGSFAVVHAGWRGALAGIAGKAVRELARADGASSEGAGAYNAYIGPHIQGPCFEVSADIVRTFREAFGSGCVVDERHVSLKDVLQMDLMRQGMVPERIVDSGLCTHCRPSELFSYRASGGRCGRHGALAVRR